MLLPVSDCTCNLYTFNPSFSVIFLKKLQPIRLNILPGAAPKHGTDINLVANNIPIIKLPKRLSIALPAYTSHGMACANFWHGLLFFSPNQAKKGRPRVSNGVVIVCACECVCERLFFWFSLAIDHPSAAAAAAVYRCGWTHKVVGKARTRACTLHSKFKPSKLTIGRAPSARHVTAAVYGSTANVFPPPANHHPLCVWVCG